MMRCRMQCFECTRKQLEERPEGLHLFRTYFPEIRHDQVVDFTCREGHRNLYLLTAERFELLFDVALEAIADGYYREAVSSSSAALERFFEFCLRVFARSNGTDPAQFDSFWKSISAQSERQLGAFLFAYLAHFGNPPKLLHQDLVTFRNNVIHKGVFPTRDAAIGYCNAVLAVIASMASPLREGFRKEMDWVRLEYLQKLSDSAAERPRGSFCSSFLSGLSVDASATIDQRLGQIERGRFESHPAKLDPHQSIDALYDCQQ